MSRLPCFVRLPFLFASLFFLIINFSIASAADKSWQTGEGSDPANDGRPVAWLDYGVPETDDIQVRIACKAQDAGAPELDAVFGAPLGDLKNGAETVLIFTGDGFEHEVPGKVHGVGAEVGIAGVKLEAGIDDALWDALTQKDSLEYRISGQGAASLPLKDGHRRIGNFVEACRSFVKEEPVRTAEAKSPDQDRPAPESGISEREAYDAAKELGTIEAWEAFLENFPDGFRADLARAYVNRLGSEGATNTGKATEKSAETTVAETPPPPAPADISLAMTTEEACRGGRNCSVTVTATNTGGEPFSGDLTIATSLAPGGAELQGTGIPPFSCEGAGGGAICSTGLANIAPGQSATIPMTFTLPRNAGGQVTTCASIAWGGVPAALQPADVQRKLNELGFDAGPVDGKPGRQTVAAIREFQKSSGIQETGEIDLPLLLALFAPGGPGDANPLNDQACAGAAVTSAPPLPAAFQGPTCPLGQVIRESGECGCPSSVPIWTGTSCIPRLARNCNRGRIYDKSQKLCVCPGSRPHWYNNRCHARFDDCPGDSVRVGDKCLKENDPGFAARPRPSGPNLNVGCGRNSIRIGNVCVNIANAPVFGGRPGRGGGGRVPRGNAKTDTCPGDSARNAQGVCVKQNDAGPGGNPNNFFTTIPYQVVPGAGQNQAQQGKCPAGQTLIGTDGGNSMRCVPSVAGKQCPYPGQVLVKGKVDACICTGGAKLVGNKCINPAFQPKGGGQTATQSAPCPSGTHRMARDGLCLPGNCPAGTSLSADRRICIAGQGGGQTATQPKPTLTEAEAGAQILSHCNSLKLPASQCKAMSVFGAKEVMGKANPASSLATLKQQMTQQANQAKPQNTVLKTCKANEKAANCICPAGMVKDAVSPGTLPCRPVCPAGQSRLMGVCCPNGWSRQGNSCAPPAGQAAVPIKTQTLTTKDGVCPPGTVRYSKGGKCVAGKCPTNAVRIGDGTCFYGLKPQPKVQQAVPPPVVKQVRPQQQPKPQPTHVVNCAGGQRTGNGCQCPAGQAAKLVSARKTPDGSTTKNYTCVAVGIQCGPGTHAAGGSCVSDKPPPGTVSKEIFCAPGTGLVPQNGKCGCPPGLTWNGKVCAAQQQQKPQQTFQQQKKAAPPQQLKCVANQIRLPNGGCGCPNGLSWSNGKCRQPKGVNQFLQQQQQPSQNQQQQQIQKLNNILKQLSDRRLKRDIELVETRADGLKLYSFRYLWDDTQYVGVMAQDLLVDPARADAVSLHESGYYMVDYGKLGLKMTVLKAVTAAGRQSSLRPDGRR